MAITLNPYGTTGVSNGFVLNQNGYVQGAAMDDIVSRQAFEGGVVGASTTVWGAVPVILTFPATTAGAVTGPIVTVATSMATIGGWVVFNQASAGVISPGNPVPLYGAGMSCNFVRAGSKARVPIKIDPTLVNSLLGGTEAVQLGFDFTALQIIAYASGTALPVTAIELNTNSKTITYNSGTGLAAWNDTGSVALCQV